MSVQEKILFIVEGARLEREVIKRISQVYHFECEIASVCTNIYSLFQRLKRDEGFSDVVPVLREFLHEQLLHLQKKSENFINVKQIRQKQDDLRILASSFSSIYLIFDSDLQHYSLFPPDEAQSSQQEIIVRNVSILKEMLVFFNNETEQGKLYVNYPMMESYMDCDSFFEDSYRDRAVSLKDIFEKKYKSMVSQKRLGGLKTEKITQENFNQLTCMNAFKLNWITREQWEKPNYDDFRVLSEQCGILEAEEKYCWARDAIAVLNTMLFFVIDYKGREFYNQSIGESLS